MWIQPLTLRVIVGWLIAGILLFVPIRLTAQTIGRIIVGPTVWISAMRPDDTHTESYIAADPHNAQRLIACTMIYNAHDFPKSPSGASITVTYASLDGGRRWRPTLTVHSAGQTWDPGCTYGSDGVAYSISEGYRVDGHSYVELDRSDDGGDVWSVQARIRHMERAQIVTDQRSSGSAGRLYIYGSDGSEDTLAGIGGGIRVFSSSNSGRTFEQNRLPPDRGEYATGSAPGALLQDGRLIASFYSIPWPSPPLQEAIIGRHFEKQYIRVFTMRDSRSYVPSILSSHLVSVSDIIEPSYTDATIPNIAVDSSDGPFKDRIYVVWNDWQEGRANILLSYSSDAGKTWSSPSIVNDDLPRVPRSRGPDDFMPVVAVNKFGVVGVSWYDRRAFLDNQGWSERFAASLDGGDTFTPSVPVSNISFDASRARRLWISPNTWVTPKGTSSPQQTELDINHFTFDAGDTAGLAADANGGFHPLWIANPNGTAQLYTTTVSVHGEALPNGSVTFAKLHDVDQAIVLDYYQSSYDRSTGILTTRAFLQNMSTSAVHGPFFLRALSVHSELGAISIVNADGGGTGEGAFWSFTSPDITGDSLQPNERTKARTLLFKLSNPSLAGLLDGTKGGRGYPDVGLRGANIGLLRLTTKILAGN